MNIKYTIALFLTVICTSAVPAQALSLPLSDSPDEEKHYYQVSHTIALSQLPELPNGCEAVAATMLLNWAGVDVSKEEIANGLPKGPLPSIQEDGSWEGANPQDVFVGDPFDVGYGIYHKPVAELLERYLPGRIIDLTGSPLDKLLDTVKSGRPVLVWATEHMDPPELKDEWVDPVGNLVDWYDPEHALLLTGWDDDNAYLNDPMTGGQEAYNLWSFKTVWEAMGSQAITVAN
ncbi:C39 family peptidase [Paenibacillus aestuarii]|uniref:C39 family peptidase n=1 Tax=Paenibacillus aestuarii TaxID=516965 RepID=A0ABW0K2T0_9BACL|nr:C39 family peptidase [Paenibacillus aestuarii]